MPFSEFQKSKDHTYETAFVYILGFIFYDAAADDDNDDNDNDAKTDLCNK